MEATTSSPKQSIEEDNHMNERNRNRVKKQEIQSVIAKAMELRALHATLMQQANNYNSPSHLRFPSPSPSAQHNNPHFSAQDYPVFTPSNEDEPVHGIQHFQMESGNNYDEYGVLGEVHEDESNLSRKANASSRKGFNCDLVNLETLAEDFTSSYTNNPTIMLSGSSPPGAADFSKSRRSSLSEFRSVSSYNNRCNYPAIIRPDLATNKKNSNNLVVPLTDIHSSVHSQPKMNRGGMMNLLRLFPRLNKKKNNKHMNSPNNRTDPDDVSQSFKDFGGGLSIEALKKEILEANEKRDTALKQVAEMRSSIGELSQKLEYLEKYCEDLKKALKQATIQVNNSHHHHTDKKLERSFDYHIEKGETAMMPVSEEVMIEGFIQIVSEARLSVKQFCKTLVEQIEQTDNSLMASLNMLLLPYKLSVEQKLSKAVFYHLEAIMNQYLYQDFENCVFQNNGTPKFLDPQRERESQFSSFISLRNLSWNEVLRKGTKYYSEEFSKFCDQKMSYVIAAMNWTRPWPEQLLQAFFVSAKCIWLLHLLAFSFNPPLGIIRVDEKRSYDPQFMEDLAIDKQKSHNSSRIKIMVMPGFYVHDRVLRCQVLCRFKTVK